MLWEILESREDDIVEQWLDRVLAAYPEDGGAVFKRRTDRFANPVGSTARAGTKALFRALRRDEIDATELAAQLEGTLRIRAVQDMSASTALGWITALKQVVRSELKAHGLMGVDPTELRTFEDRVDRLVLIGFDVYTHCREEVARLKIREAQRRVEWVVDRLNERGPARPVSPPEHEPTSAPTGHARSGAQTGGLVHINTSHTREGATP